MTLNKYSPFLIVALAAALCLGPVEAKGRDRRIVAVGDIHGSYSGLVGILQTAGLIDENHDWSGGKTILAQTGDFFDRGPDVRKVMDLLMRLEVQAKKQGGQVQVALGNHEVINLLSQFSPDYVTPEICASFTDESSTAARESAFESWLAWRKSFPSLEPVTKEQWMETFPLGFLEYQEAIGPEGKYGRWLRGLPVVMPAACRSTRVEVEEELVPKVPIEPVMRERIQLAVLRLDDPTRQDDAILALIETGDPAVPYLIEALEKQRGAGRIRLAAATCLRKITGRDFRLIEAPAGSYQERAALSDWNRWYLDEWLPRHRRGKGESNQ